MSKIGKNLGIVFLVLAVFGLGGLAAYEYLTPTQSIVKEQSSVLLEKVKSVAKLVSVEGYFSEIYTQEDKWDPFPYLPTPSFDKKAILIVKAKVSVGYDLEKMNIEVDHTNKVLRMSNIPEPEIISLDHDLEYYDIRESTFNSFTKQELTKMNSSAKEFIRKKALESELLTKAEQQGNQMLDIIEFMVKESGWTVEYEPKAIEAWD